MKFSLKTKKQLSQNESCFGMDPVGLEPTTGRL